MNIFGKRFHKIETKSSWVKRFTTSSLKTYSFYKNVSKLTKALIKTLKKQLVFKKKLWSIQKALIKTFEKLINWNAWKS